MNSTPWSYRLYRLTWTGLDLVFPPRCGGWGKVGWRWCPECQARVPRLQKPLCAKCGIPTQEGDLCEKCEANPPAYRMMRAWAVFDSPVQNGLHAMKYRHNIGLGEAIAVQMVDFVRSLNWPVEILMPVPLGKNRLKKQGYNQVGLVSRPLAYRLGLRYEPDAIWKMRETRSRVGLTVNQRQANVHNAYQADPNVVNRKSILIMDEVATTGSTIASSTEALLSAGAQDVYVITIARALPHHSLDRV